MGKTDLEIIDYPRLIMKSSKLVVLGMIICGVIAGVITLFLPDRFEATATLIAVEPRLQSEEAYSKQPFTLKRFLPLLEDKTLLKETITELGLDTSPRPLKVKNLSKMVEAELEEESELIEIKVTTPSPELSARIANSLAAGFQRKMRNVIISGVLDSKSFLQERGSDARQALSRAETAYGNFLESAGLDELHSRLETGIYLRENYAQELASAELAIRRLEGEFRAARDLEREAADRPSFSGPPRGREIELAGWKEKKKALEEMIGGNLEMIRQVQAELAAKEVEAERLKREIGIREEISREIARSYEESILAIYQQVGEIQIISRAFPPEEKSGPFLEVNILLGLLAGLFVSIMVVFYREYLKD